MFFLCLEKVSNYLILVREFPINDLLIATSVEQLTQAVRSIFAHMKKIKKNESEELKKKACDVTEPKSKLLDERYVSCS